MVEKIHYTLVFENGSTKTFQSRIEAMEYAASKKLYPKPRKLIRHKVTTVNTTIKSWE